MGEVLLWGQTTVDSRKSYPESIEMMMSTCMNTDKPRIAILMAVYKPRMDWLRKQLVSLNEQHYPNLILYMQDDCSPATSFEETKALTAECITAFPYEMKRNEHNLGYNGTFELLTREAQAEYFAYCDQDDIWMPEKLTILQETIEKENAQLVCSDMIIIDGEGKKIADSMTGIRRHHHFRSGEGLTDTLWYFNFASGCAMLMRASTAKNALPMNPYMYYDHYLTLYSANAGKVISLERPLIAHREHGKNQSSMFQGIVDRESYAKKRVDDKLEAVQWLAEHFACEEKLKRTLSQGLEWLQARQAYIRGDRKQAKTIWKYRRFSMMPSLFEIAMPYMPDCVFRAVLRAVRKNII